MFTIFKRQDSNDRSVYEGLTQLFPSGGFHWILFKCCIIYIYAKFYLCSLLGSWGINDDLWGLKIWILKFALRQWKINPSWFLVQADSKRTSQLEKHIEVVRDNLVGWVVEVTFSSKTVVFP